MLKALLQQVPLLQYQIDSILTNNLCHSFNFIQKMEDCTEVLNDCGKSQSPEYDKISISPSSEASDNETLHSYHDHLKLRLDSLQDTLKNLKTQLAQERENWRREVNDVLHYSNNLLTTAPIITEISEMESINPEHFYNYSDYEMKMRIYQDALSQQQFESRQNIQRQIAMGQYRRRLMEVDNMCNLELLRVKQNVESLQPLQMIVSDWKMETEKIPEMGMGEIGLTKDMEISEIADRIQNEVCEVAMPLEIYTSKIQHEASAILAKSRRSGNSSLPELSAQHSPNLSISPSQSAI